MGDSPRALVTNGRSLIFGAGLAIAGASFSAHVSGWPHWISIGFGYCIGLMLVAFPVYQIATSYLANQMFNSETGLEISFETLNPGSRFWSLESAKHVDGSVCNYWEYRVEVSNASHRTLRNVIVTVERTGALPQLPSASLFKRTETERCDLNPGCSELVVVLRWPEPKRQVGMLTSESAWGYGPIKVIASADDIGPVIKMYAFNYEKEQMLFDLSVFN